MTKIIIDRKTMEQAAIFERLKNKDITQKEAAALTGLTARWIREKIKRYKAHGAEGLIHKNTGKPSSRKVPLEHEKLSIELLQNKLQGAGPTYLSEKLLELHGVKINNESMRQIMIRNKVWTPSQVKPKHRKRRARRTHVGMLVQLDGSPHDWFEGRAPKCTLLVFIDDATSRLLWLEFVSGETVEEVMIATQNYFKAHGRPMSFYVDYGSVWSVNVNNPEREKLTQFERAMGELHVEVKHARSPQAKGRVERANKTLQDRLIKDMRLNNICSVDDANEFAQKTYIAHHNAKFAVEPAEPVDMHKSLDGFNLYDILCQRDERVVQNDFVVMYKNRLLQLHSQQPIAIRPKHKVTVSLHLDNKITLSIKGSKLNFGFVSERPAKILPPEKPRKETYWKPAKNHPWRTPERAPGTQHSRPAATTQ